MGRLNMRPREADLPKKGINPIWRGIGCFLFIALTVGCYFAADAVVEGINTRNRTQPFLPGALRSGIPRQFVTLIDYEFPKPVTEVAGFKLDKPLRTWRVGFDVVTLAFTLFLAVIGFSAVSLVWAVVNPPKLGPKDAPPVRRKIDRNKVR